MQGIRARQLQVGITGGIGSGKSLVCKVFRALGIPVYDADSRAKALYTSHAGLRQQVVERFGAQAYHDDGGLNSQYLSQQVFSSAEKTAELNALVHPLVFEDYKVWVTQNSHAPYLLKEAALMVESGSYRQVDVLLVVVAPQQLRLQRIVQRDPARSPQQVLHIMDRQSSDEEKIALAQVVLHNDGSAPIVPQILALHQQFLAKSQAMHHPFDHPHVAQALLMVRPTHFAFNPQTAEDNEFQNEPDLSQQEVNQLATAEHEEAVASLQRAGVQVLLHVPDRNGPKTPDAIFPNNWLATTPAGQLHLFPMLVPNRQAEVQALPAVQQLLAQHKLQAKKVEDWRDHAGMQGQVLEGTGSLVFDHLHRVAFLALSQRSSLALAQAYCQAIGYQLLAFDTESSLGAPYYHTNVVLSIGLQWAVLCADAIAGEGQRKAVMNQLAKHRELILVSREQTEQHFCANILQVRNREGQLLTVMSESAQQGFSPQQLDRLKLYGRIVALRIPTIEAVGGGSARCMLAEIFLPSQG